MRKKLSLLLLLILSLLIPILVYAWGVAIIGGSGTSAGAGCASGTIDQDFFANGDSNHTSTNYIKGQSFQVSQTGYLYSIVIYAETVDGETITMRWGPDTDLTTTYYDEAVLVGPSGWGSHELVFQDTTNQLQTSTTYYFGWRELAGEPFSVKVVTDGDPAYANGVYYAGGNDWDLTGHSDANKDFLFQVKLCD